MTYELVQQLKDAGFSFNDPLYVGYPTLNELIDACGGPFFNLTQGNNLKKWTAYKAGTGAEGQTPEEAVAKLYLALHGKEQDQGI